MSEVKYGEITWNKAGHVVIPISKNLFISADGVLYRGNIEDPDDCPQCKWRNTCPTGLSYYGIGTHRCNTGLFERGEPKTEKVRWGPKL